jgi:hypothetical protein
LTVDTVSNQTSHQEEFIKLVASNYRLLKSLYPDKELSFTQLSNKIDKSVISTSKESLEKEKLITIYDKVNEKTGRVNKMLKLTADGQRIVTYIIRLSGINQPYEESNENLIRDALSFIPKTVPKDAKEKLIADLAVDQIQLITKETSVNPNSMLFTYIHTTLNVLKYDHMKAILLLSLLQILQNSEGETREIIAGKVLQSVEKAQESNERSGEIARQILKDYFPEELFFENLKTKYLDAVKKEEYSQAHLVGNLIIQKFPDKKIEIRAELLKLLSEASIEHAQHISGLFSQFH